VNRRLLNLLTLLSLLLVVGGAGDSAGEPGNDAPAPPPGWRERFDAVYRLRDAEVIKLVPPPFIPERAIYYRHELTKNPQASLAPVQQFMFWWDGRARYWSLSSGKGTVASAVSVCGGLERYDMEIDAGLAVRPLEGDWVVRKATPPEERLAALGGVLRQRFGRDVRIEKRKAEREVVVVTGALPRDLPGGPSVRVYTDPQDLRHEPTGGGSGTLDRLFETLGGALDRKFVDKTAPRAGARPIGWHWYHSASAADRDAAKARLLLDNVSRQTGLRFTIRTAEVEVWAVTDEAEGKTGL
jgi:hypothetical protein